MVYSVKDMITKHCWEKLTSVSILIIHSRCIKCTQNDHDTNKKTKKPFEVSRRYIILYLFQCFDPKCEKFNKTTGSTFRISVYVFKCSNQWHCSKMFSSRHFRLVNSQIHFSDINLNHQRATIGWNLTQQLLRLNWTGVRSRDLHFILKKMPVE